MQILIVNAGSSSLKFQLIDSSTEVMIAKGGVERIGQAGAFIKFESSKGETKHSCEIPNHEKAIELALGHLIDVECGVISTFDNIDAIGHRMIHGGEKYTQAVLVTDQILADFEASVHLAPLHFPPNILGVKAALKMLPNKPNIAVFDTAFHSTLPQYAYMYALPMDMYTEHQIRKYGFHGSSHKFIATEATKLLGKVEGTKIISCHLGNGSSICAIKEGKSIDTTMGYTPLEGLMMGTRSGDIDASIVAEIMKYKNKDVTGAINYLNKESGLLGVSGFTSDMRDIENNMDNPRVRLAYDMLVYKIVKYIGSYTAVLGGLDALVFTGGIGENTTMLRYDVCKALEWLGVKIDVDKNANEPRGTQVTYSTPDSKVQVYRIPTNEELVIARETVDACKKITK